MMAKVRLLSISLISSESVIGLDTFLTVYIAKSILKKIQVIFYKLPTVSSRKYFYVSLKSIALRVRTIHFMHISWYDNTNLLIGMDNGSKNKLVHGEG